jgi:hypothetical protein
MSINRFNMVLAWFSVFLLSWMMILGRVATDVKGWGFFAFFLAVAFCAAVSDLADYKNKLAKRNPNKEKPE